MSSPSFNSWCSGYRSTQGVQQSLKYNDWDAEFVPPVPTTRDSCNRLRTVTIRERRIGQKTAVCAWCGKEIELNQGRGRKRKYCGPSCKQRAYEQRTLLAETSVDPDAVILSQQKVDEIRDRLFELRCAAEDIQTAATEGASASELGPLCDELVGLAQKLEKLR